MFSVAKKIKKRRWNGEERVTSSTKKEDGVGKSGLGPVQKKKMEWGRAS
jgi:hypothetical protein